MRTNLVGRVVSTRHENRRSDLLRQIVDAKPQIRALLAGSRVNRRVLLHAARCREHTTGVARDGFPDHSVSMTTMGALGVDADADRMVPAVASPMTELNLRSSIIFICSAEVVTHIRGCVAFAVACGDDGANITVLPGHGGTRRTAGHRPASRERNARARHGQFAVVGDRQARECDGARVSNDVCPGAVLPTATVGPGAWLTR